MMHGNGMGTGWEGMYTTSLLDFHANWRSRADELSDTLKICMFMGQYYLKHHRGHYYAKAQNLARQLREEYDKMFGACDLLLMPTLPMKATPPPPGAPLALYCRRAFETLPNPAPFDVTGRPATSLPCGMSDGLPVGLGREAAAAGAHLTTIETMTMAAGALHAAPGQPTEARGLFVECARG